jgi:hypothetical protein
MKRAKLRGLQRNAAVVLGNVGTVDDVSEPARALDDPEPLVREHARGRSSRSAAAGSWLRRSPVRTRATQSSRARPEIRR